MNSRRFYLSYIQMGFFEVWQNENSCKTRLTKDVTQNNALQTVQLQYIPNT